MLIVCCADGAHDLFELVRFISFAFDVDTLQPLRCEMIHLFFFFSLFSFFFSFTRFLNFVVFSIVFSSVRCHFHLMLPMLMLPLISLLRASKIDEYTRISTPRSEVLFKKGYLMRDKKYAGPTNTISAAAGTTTSPSNDSGSVSVISNEETASFYSIQSMSPDDSNSMYMNGGGGGNSSSTDSNSATYPNDNGFEHDLSLIYSSGFYDNNGYFYVNRM